MTNEAETMSEDTENPEIPAADEAAAVNEAELQAEQDSTEGGDAPDTSEGDDPEIVFEASDRLAELEEQVADLNDKLLRAVAETENVRRRSQREKDDASKYAIAGFAADMVSVADNLTRALGAIDDETRAAEEAVSNLMAGVEITLRDLLNTFERTGIKRIEALDKPFDHNLHEAMFEMEDLSKPVGTVIQVIQEGYTLRGRLLRPTKVGVAKGGPAAQSAPEEQGEEPTRENTPEQTKAYEAGKQGPGGTVDEEL